MNIRNFKSTILSSIHWLCVLLLWELTVVEFQSLQMKFNRFLHPNELPQRIFWYLVRQLDWGQSKIGYFQFLKTIFRPKINLITLKMIFVLEYQTRRTTFSNNIFSFIHTHQILFSKNVPYFCQLSTKLSCKISENPLRMFIWM